MVRDARGGRFSACEGRVGRSRPAQRDRTLSRAKVRTAYSANVSDFTRVILMSPYISESSGQYLEHFTCEERTGWGFSSAEEAPGRARAQRERKRMGSLPGPPPPAWLSSRCWNSAPATPCARSRTPSPAWALRDGGKAAGDGRAAPRCRHVSPPPRHSQPRSTSSTPFPPGPAVPWGSRRGGSCSTLLPPRLAPNWPPPSLSCPRKVKSHQGQTQLNQELNRWLPAGATHPAWR